MVGLVIVSHSAALAQGVKELAEQMTRGQGQIAVAGGIDDPENPIGTDAFKVQAAIESVFSEDGVLVLMDLGSALLSAEMALEFLEPAQQEKVKLCAAPIVEGAVAAAVQASIGSTLEQVMHEAMGALSAKMDQLSPAMGVPPGSDMTRLPGSNPDADSPCPAEPPGDTVQITITILNRMGLHARPAANFVKTAGRFQSNITVAKGEKTANAKSINQVATLGAGHNDSIVVKATGPDARAALDAIQVLAEDKFGDKEDNSDIPQSSEAPPASAPQKNADGILTGIPASPGIAIGPVAHYTSRMPEVTATLIENGDVEWEKFQGSLDQAKQDLDLLKNQAARQIGADQAAIFDAQQMFLDDPALLDGVKDQVINRKINAESAWSNAIEAMADEYRRLEDPYLRERAADVIDVGRRVLRHLLGEALPGLDFLHPSIVFAFELTPSDTARLNPEKVLAFCTEQGGATSHSAIVAKALGIPAVVGLPQGLGDVPEGTVVALDGTNGQVWPRPTQVQLTELQSRRDRWISRQNALKAQALQPAVTKGKDAKTIEVAANIGGPFDTGVALDYGADGVGLFRTEFLFLGRSQAPTEEEQLAAYAEVAAAMGKQPLVIRTLDVGGDKFIPYLDMAPEENPFLGLRGIRFCLEHPEVFKPQLRAILKASHGHNIKIMFPMISSQPEFCKAKAMLNEVKQELTDAEIPFDDTIEVGLMIEVPSAVAVADQLAEEADFFSIGSNDLTQYVMGADRGNRKVSHLTNALHPAVLRMVSQTAAAARQAGIWVGMCGELAGNPLVTPILVGMGLDELSMNAPAIPDVKKTVGNVSMSEAREMAQAVINLTSPQQVLDYLNSKYKN